MSIPLAFGADIPNPLVAPSAAVTPIPSGVFVLPLGDIADGTYLYAYTWVTRFGETKVSPTVSVVSTRGSIDLSNIAVWTQVKLAASARRIYRSMVGGTDLFLVATIDDNMTTRYTDVLADADLGAAAPIANMAGTVERIEGVTQLAHQLIVAVETLAATGVDRDTAAEITAQVVTVTGSGGVVLPPIRADRVGLQCNVNAGASAVTIYPYELTSSIGGAPPGTSYSLAAGFSLNLICTGASEWNLSSSLTSGVAGPPSGAAGGVLIGTYPNPSIAPSGVSAGVYGSGTQSAVVTVGLDGRVTAAAQTPITITAVGAAGGSLAGNYPNPTIAPSGVTAGIYGNAIMTPRVTVAADGRVSAITEVATVAMATGAAGGSLTGFYPNPTLQPTGVTSNVYGNSQNNVVVTVLPDGRISNISTTPSQATAAGPASGDLTGDYPGPFLAPSGVIAGTYGSAGAVPIVTVDTKGRITAVSTAAPTLGGIAGGALTGLYPNPQLSNTGVVPGGYAKVQVSIDGRVTQGLTLLAGDLPNIAGDVIGPYASTLIGSIQGANVSLSNGNFLIGVGGMAGGLNTAVNASLQANTSGASNTAYGRNALNGNVTASDSTAIGATALLVATGGSNTAVGSGAGSGITTGASNIILGVNAGGITTGSNNIVLGGNASAVGVSNEITLGNSAHTRVRFANAGVIPIHVNNAAAVLAGLSVGMLYRTGGDPDVLCIVH